MTLDLIVTFKGSAQHFALDEAETIGSLKLRLEELWNIPVANQKLMSPALKGPDDKLLSSCKLKNGSKIILVGSTKEEVEKIQQTVSAKELFQEDLPESKWETEEKHKRIIKSGIPPGAETPLENDTPFPSNSTITHLRNSFGQPLRMTFKFDHIAFHTNGGTTHLPFTELQDIQFQELSDHPGYFIVLFRTVGESVSKNCFVYFVPKQYTKAISVYSPSFLSQFLV